MNQRIVLRRRSGLRPDVDQSGEVSESCVVGDVGIVIPNEIGIPDANIGAGDENNESKSEC